MERRWSSGLPESWKARMGVSRSPAAPTVAGWHWALHRWWERTLLKAVIAACIGLEAVVRQAWLLAGVPVAGFSYASTDRRQGRTPSTVALYQRAVQDVLAGGELAYEREFWTQRPLHASMARNQPATLELCPALDSGQRLLSADPCYLTTPQQATVPGGTYTLHHGPQWLSALNLPLLPANHFATAHSF
jgi:hypothetical protein